MSLPQTLSDPVKSRAELASEEKLEREKRRSLELAEQRSDQNPPEIRIRVWEKLHGLRMPADPAHPILDVIAVSTRLSIVEVQAAQRQRAERTSPSRADDVSASPEPGA